MPINAVLTPSERSSVLAHLRSLRNSLAQARDALMHFKTDRVDRDMLEPAARRVDDLMNKFAGDFRDPRQGAVWVTEILGGVERVTNPKAAIALNEARVDINALLTVMGSEVERQST
jgi:plasmid stabilization system protein ParE